LMGGDFDWGAVAFLSTVYEIKDKKLLLMQLALIRDSKPRHDG